MTVAAEISNHSTDKPTGPKFSADNSFQIELRKRVNAFFESTGKRPRDCPQMYFKSAVLFTSFIVLYILLVFVAQHWWQAVPITIALGLATAGIGLNIQHDASHNGYSGKRWINRLMAMSLDLIGGSSYLWYYRHEVLHHTYTNIEGHDSDIDLGFLARMTPHQKRLKIHRWQHLYMWLLYGLMAIRWQLFGDYRDVALGDIAGHPIPRPKGWNLVVFIAGKVMLLALVLGIPILVHSWWVILIFYAATSVIVGITLSIVFQLAHSVEDAVFLVPSDTNRIEHAWAVHQIESTVDFARGDPLMAWLLGGLNYQIEHHLFPRICHIHYPAISKIVEQTCREYGVKYSEHRTFWSGIASHFRWLRRMGKTDPAVPAPQ